MLFRSGGIRSHCRWLGRALNSAVRLLRRLNGTRQLCTLSGNSMLVETTDRMLIFGERHLRRVLAGCDVYYNTAAASGAAVTAATPRHCRCPAN